MSTPTKPRAIACMAQRTDSLNQPERTWAQIAAQASQVPIKSEAQMSTVCRIRKTNGTVNLVQKSGAKTVVVPRTFIASRKPAPEFTCSPLSTPPDSRQSSVSSSATIVIPLAPVGKKRFTYAQAVASRPQGQTKAESAKRSNRSSPGKPDTRSVTSSNGEQVQTPMRRIESHNPFWALRDIVPRSNSGSSTSSDGSRSPFLSAREYALNPRQDAGSTCLGSTGSREQQDCSVGASGSESINRLLNTSSDSASAVSSASESETRRRSSFKGPKNSRDRPRPLVLTDEEKYGLNGYGGPMSSPISISGHTASSGTWTRCRNIWNDSGTTPASPFEEKNRHREQQLLQMIEDNHRGIGQDHPKHYRGDSDDAVFPVIDSKDIDVAVSVFNSLATPSHAQGSQNSYTKTDVIAPMTDTLSFTDLLGPLLSGPHDAEDHSNSSCSHEANMPSNIVSSDGKVQQTTNSHTQGTAKVGGQLRGAGQTHDQTMNNVAMTSPSQVIAPVMKLQDLFDRYKDRNLTFNDDKSVTSTMSSEQGQQRVCNSARPVQVSTIYTSSKPASIDKLKNQMWDSRAELSKTPNNSASVPFGWKTPSQSSPTAQEEFDRMLSSGYKIPDNDIQECRQQIGCVTPCGTALLDPTAPTFSPIDWRILKKRMSPYYNTCVSSSVQPPPCPPIQQPPSQLLPPRTPKLRPISPIDIPQYEVEQLPSPYQPPRSIFSSAKSHVLTSSPSPSYPSVPASPTEMRHRRGWRAPSRMMSGYVGAQKDGLELQQHLLHSQHHYNQSQQARQYSLSPHRKYAYAHPSVYEVSPVGSSVKHCGDDATRMASGIGRMSLEDRNNSPGGDVIGSTRSSSESSVVLTSFLDFVDPNMDEDTMESLWKK
ncbi:hypothetical protein AAP_04772 [Ascosphaera apis ARSEF 7405]|uniref:Uncharacterized protein n=1 Tax=Ascosphaera apis ARSEF 7405 TaxID=392613 RepID=A0A167WCJ7_9EURO|nr:hypothetical protein AAP_04772 [Ascosphaera apis ARSEF 7405]